MTTTPPPRDPGPTDVAGRPAGRTGAWDARTWERALLREVRAGHRWSGGSAAGSPRCHVGTPAGVRCVLAGEELLRGADAGVRADLVERALDGLESLEHLAVWVVRPGPLDLGDLETAWCAAARHAFARHGLRRPAFFVVSRTGWLAVTDGPGDRPWSGAPVGAAGRREWRRLRPLPPGPWWPEAPPGGTFWAGPPGPGRRPDDAESPGPAPWDGSRWAT